MSNDMKHWKGRTYRLDLRGLLQDLDAEAFAATGDSAYQSSNAGTNDGDTEGMLILVHDHDCFCGALRGMGTNGGEIGLGLMY